MAKVVFNNTDTLAEFIEKMNSVATGTGNISLLDVKDSNIVHAVNILRDDVSKYDDSTEIVKTIRTSLSEFKASGEGTLNYNPTTGVMSLAGSESADYYYLSAERPLIMTNGGPQLRMSDSSINSSLITDETVSLTKDYNYVTMFILDEDSNTLFTFYTPEI